jgi:putative spermidine/putrescine transport system ATP-binding protein
MGAMGERLPGQLSGGQQQRVALARALVFDPQLVLMDEPLGALDKQLREHMQIELKALHRQLGITFVYVTHDQAEALTMSDRVAVFNEGVIQQIDRVDRLYEEPVNRFVAGFVGDNTVIEGRSDGGNGVQLHNGIVLRGRPMQPCQAQQALQASIRPERISLAPPEQTANTLEVTLRDVIYFGDHLRLRCLMDGQPEISVKVHLENAGVLEPDSRVRLYLPPEHLRLYP